MSDAMLWVVEIRRGSRNKYEFAPELARNLPLLLHVQAAEGKDVTVEGWYSAKEGLGVLEESRRRYTEQQN